MLQTVLNAAVGSKDSGMVEEVLGCLKDNVSESKVETPSPSLTKPTCKYSTDKETDIPRNLGFLVSPVRNNTVLHHFGEVNNADSFSPANFTAGLFSSPGTPSY